MLTAEEIILPEVLFFHKEVSVKKSEIYFDRVVGAFVGVEESWASALQKAFPTVAIQRELEKMALWLQYTPKGKRRRGGMKFILSWLNRICPSVPPEEDLGPESISPVLDEVLEQHLERLWKKNS